MANHPVNLVREQTMIIRAGFGIAFELSQPTPMVLMLSVHPSRTKHILTDPRIVASPGLPMPWPTNQDDRHRRSRRGARNRQAHAAPDKTDVIGRRVLSAQGRSPARRYCNYNSTLVPSFHDLIPLPYRVESTSFMVTGCQAFGSRCDSL
jgi:hypothetical protein